jgi:hypothetical protein
MGLAAERPQVIIVVGAEGTSEYGEQFRTWGKRWWEGAKKGQAAAKVIGLSPAAEDDADRKQLEELLSKSVEEKSPLWLIFIGHGTFDGKVAKFNLRGDDVSAGDLSQWLKDHDRPLAVIDCTSCSGPFLSELSGKNRVVITATKSGHEYNFARFGDYLSQAILDPKCDLDKDDQTSLLEAYLFASAQVREFYKTEARLATEHALLEDNGDRLGTPAEWFQGLRPTKAAKDGAQLDGSLARTFVLVPAEREEKLPEDVRARRDELEKQLAALRGRKKELDEAAYFAELEQVLVELARLTQENAQQNEVSPK